jgi:hypothetical protein
MRACLDIPGDSEGGRVVDAEAWLHEQRADAREWSAIMSVLRSGRPWRALSGAWSLTPLEGDD